ncbi:hypothetical protein GGR98_003453 [Parageobacillus caldoxylosilyticus]|nr:hypothetical protein [Parageobacillus caldoxylosilyticus]
MVVRSSTVIIELFMEKAAADIYPTSGFFFL